MLTELNEAQKEAVTHIDGPMLILAGGRERKNQNPDNEAGLSDRRSRN